MTSSFENDFDLAELALAALSDFNGVPRVGGLAGELASDRVKERLVRADASLILGPPSAEMVSLEADRFLQRFDVLDQFTDGSITNGFSATLFREKTTGQLYFVNRGTTPTDIGDILTDAKLALGGKPLDQIVSMSIATCG